MAESCHLQTHAMQQMGLFDHLVGAGEQRGRHLEAERLGGRQIDAASATEVLNFFDNVPRPRYSP
jgi:hypothetical protein